MSITKSTVVVYEYSESTNELTIPFDYLKREFVVVSLEGKGKPPKALKLNVDYRFSTKTSIVMIRLYQPSEGYTKVAIRRVTEASKRIINFQDGSILNATELNTSQLQALHVAEEARDLTAYTLFVDNDGNLNARGRVIVNLGDPVNPQDAVTKKYVDTASESVIDSRNKTLQYRNEAEEFKNQAQSFSTKAQEASESARQSATTIESKLDEAIALDKQAVASSTKAVEAMKKAQASETVANSSALKAKASEDEANASKLLCKQYVDSVDPYSFVKCNTINDLKNVQPTRDGTVALVKGYYSNTTLGGGVFVYNENDANTPEDGGTVIISTVTGKRWLRQYEELTLHDFGAKGDGVSIDTDAFKKAFSISRNIIAGRHNFVIDDTIPLKGDSKVDFTGAKVTWKGPTSVPMFHYKAPAERLHLKGGLFIGNAQSFLKAEGVTPNASSITDYARFFLSEVSVSGMEFFLDAQKASRYFINNCFTFTDNGIRNEGKCVETYISNSTIFGSTGRRVGTKGIWGKLHPETTMSGKYPEGLHVTNCTIDGFENSLFIESAFVVEISNCYTSGMTFAKEDNPHWTHTNCITVKGNTIDGAITFRQANSGVTYKANIEGNTFIRKGLILLGNNTDSVSIKNNLFHSSSGESPVIAIVFRGNRSNIEVIGNSIDHTFSKLLVDNGSGPNCVITDNIKTTEDATYIYAPKCFVKGNKWIPDYKTVEIPRVTLESNQRSTTVCSFNVVKGYTYNVKIRINYTNTKLGYLKVEATGSTGVFDSGNGWSSVYSRLPQSETEAFIYTETNFKATETGTTNFILKNENAGTLRVSYQSTLSIEIK